MFFPVHTGPNSDPHVLASLGLTVGAIIVGCLLL
jgi:hypothetical protein